MTICLFKLSLANIGKIQLLTERIRLYHLEAIIIYDIYEIIHFAFKDYKIYKKSKEVINYHFRLLRLLGMFYFLDVFPLVKDEIFLFRGKLTLLFSFFALKFTLSIPINRFFYLLSSFTFSPFVCYTVSDKFFCRYCFYLY